MKVVLYTKPSCHLCDEVKADLVTLQKSMAFDLYERNILEDATLTEQFQYLVPVVEITGTRLVYPPQDYLSLYNALSDMLRSSEAKA